MNRNFFLLIQGQFISTVGTQVALTATLFWLKQQTGSATLLSLLMASCAAATVLLSPVGGARADRYSRKAILVNCDLACGIISLALATLIWLCPAYGTAQLAGIFFVNIALSAIHAFFIPAANAAVPDVLPPEKVAAGMSWSHSLFMLGKIAGQAIGGLLLSLGTPVLFAIDGLSYLFTAAAESRVVMRHHHQHRQENAEHSFWTDILSGFRYVSERPGMRTLFLSAIPLNMLSAPVFVLLPIYTTDLLHLHSAWYGYLMAALSAGSMVGYGVAGAFRITGGRLLKAVSGAVFLTSILMASLGWQTDRFLAFLILFVIGALMGWVSITALTLFQLGTESTARGRVFGLVLTTTQGLTPIAMLLAGVAADLTGNNLRLIYSMAGVGSLVVGLRLSTSAALRQFFTSAFLTDDKNMPAESMQ